MLRLRTLRACKSSESSLWLTWRGESLVGWSVFARLWIVEPPDTGLRIYTALISILLVYMYTASLTKELFLDTCWVRLWPVDKDRLTLAASFSAFMK